jgi:hypothetical protein
MVDTEKHIFTANDGTEYPFDTEEEMFAFGVKFAMGNLAARGVVKLTNVNGEEGFEITDKGRRALLAGDVGEPS